MGVGPVCRTSLSTGLSEWELGSCHTEWSPIPEAPPSYLPEHPGSSGHWAIVIALVLTPSCLGFRPLHSKTSVHPGPEITTQHPSRTFPQTAPQQGHPANATSSDRAL